MQKTLKKYFVIFTVPTLFAFCLAFIVPFAMGLYLSFCKFTTVTDATFIGLKNYFRAFEEPDFINATLFTVKFAVIAILSINIFDGIVTYQKNQRNQSFQNCFLYAKLNWWNYSWIYLAVHD